MTHEFPGAGYDNKIYTKFSQKTIAKKTDNKNKFCEEFEILCDRGQMLLGVVGELSEQNGAALLVDILSGIRALNIVLVVRGLASKKYQDILLDFAEKNPSHFLVLPDTEIAVRKIFAATDTIFFFSGGKKNEPLIQSALSYASLPIAPVSEHHILEDYNPNQERGNSFLFSDIDKWSAFAAIVRAHENFRFPYDWKNIQKTAIGH